MKLKQSLEEAKELTTKMSREDCSRGSVLDDEEVEGVK